MIPPGGREIMLPCLILLGAMFNLTLVVAGLKEFVIDDLGGSVADATLFFSVETFAYILFAPIWGLLSDRVQRRKPFIIVGFLLSAGIYWMYWSVDSVQVLLVLRFIQGAFSVMGWSLVMALVLDRPHNSGRGRDMGIMGASLILGVALGAPIGGYFSRWGGPRAPLAAAAALFAVLAISAFFLRERSFSTSQVRIGEVLTGLKSCPNLLVPMLFHFVDRLAVGLFVVVFPLFLDSLGAGDPAARGRYLSLFLIPFALLQLATGRIIEKVGPFKPLFIGSIVYGVLLCTVGYADLLLLWPVMIALGVSAAVMFPPAILLTARLSTPLTRGSAMGGFNLAGSLGFALGPLLGGWVYLVWGFGAAFVMCGLLEIAVGLLGPYLVRDWSREDLAAIGDETSATE